MNISTLSTKTLAAIGKTAVTYPETWVMSFALLGMAIGSLLYAATGYWLGAFSGHALTGAWCGMGFYAYGAAQNLEIMNARVDAQVSKLRELQQEVPF